MEPTKQNMETSNCFKLKENTDGPFSWNGKPVKILGGARFQIVGKKYNFNDNIHQAVSNVSPGLNKISADDFIAFNDILKTVH